MAASRRSGRLRVAVVGAGIGGLTLARSLHRRGVDAVVHEQAPALTSVGAGIQLSPNAVRLLAGLAIGPALAARAVRLEVGWELRRWSSGEVLFSQALGAWCEHRYGAPYYVLERAALVDCLLDATASASLRLGQRCVGVDQDETGATLRFEDGTTEGADVVVGADGVHSVVRDAVSAATGMPRFSGLAAYRALIPLAAVPAEAHRPVATSWLGPGRHLVHYPVSESTLNVVAAVPSGTWRRESWSAPADVAGFRAAFAGWDERVTSVVGAAEEVTLHSLYDREPLPRWVRGRVALLGDAAHPMLPALAQGAAQAIEDAHALAPLLAAARPRDVPAALEAYVARRRDRATRIQQLSRQAPDEYHLPDGLRQRERDAGLASHDMVSRHDWIWAARPEAVVT